MSLPALQLRGIAKLAHTLFQTPGLWGGSMTQ